MAALWPGEAIGVTRTTARHAALASAGVRPTTEIPAFRADDCVVFAVSGSSGQRAALAGVAGGRPARAVLISSTGVYGDASGVVTEHSPLGAGDRSAGVAAAEGALWDWIGVAGSVVRAGGLYRAGRGPFAALARSGVPRRGPPDKTLALIHYDDVAAAVIGLLTHPDPQPVYNAVTPPCPTRQAFYVAACDRLGLPPPVFSQPTGRPLATWDVSLLRRDLLASAAWPDWRAALG